MATCWWPLLWSLLALGAVLLSLPGIPGWHCVGESSQQRRWSLTTQLSLGKRKAGKPKQGKGVCKAAMDFMLQCSRSNVKVITSPPPLPTSDTWIFSVALLRHGQVVVGNILLSKKCSCYSSKRGWVFSFNSKPQEVPLSISHCHFWTLSPPRLTTLMNWTY